CVMSGMPESGTTTMPDESVAARKKDVVDRLLVCPSCLERLSHDKDSYKCLRCGTVFPVINGIPRFVGDLPEDTQQVRQSFDLEHSQYLDSRYVHFGPWLLEQWL